jgi:hypothetical protein
VEPVPLLVVGIDAGKRLGPGQHGCLARSHYSTSSSLRAPGLGKAMETAVA